MPNKFKNIFLVCVDHGDDLNYVLARNPSLKKARQAADEAKNRWPGKQIYISVEKQFEPGIESGQGSSAGHYRGACVCGKGEGACVSNLSCKCNAIAICKQMKVELDPFPMGFGSFTTSQETSPDMESAELNVVSVRRGIVEVSIPDWDPEETIGLSPNEIPQEIMNFLEPGAVLEAEVNLEAANADQIVIENLRLVYEDDDDEDDEDYEDDNDDNHYLSTNTSYYNTPLSSPFDKPSLPGDENSSEENSLNEE